MGTTTKTRWQSPVSSVRFPHSSGSGCFKGRRGPLGRMMRASLFVTLGLLLCALVVSVSSLELNAHHKTSAHHRRTAASAAHGKRAKIVSQQSAGSKNVKPHTHKNVHKKVSTKGSKTKLHNLEKDVTIEELAEHVTSGLNEVTLMKNALNDANDDLKKALEEIAELKSEVDADSEGKETSTTTESKTVEKEDKNTSEKQEDSDSTTEKLEKEEKEEDEQEEDSISATNESEKDTPESDEKVETTTTTTEDSTTAKVNEE